MITRSLSRSLAAAVLVASSTARADGPPGITDDAIARITDTWRERVVLVVVDAGPGRAEADRVESDPKSIYWKRRVGCAIAVGHPRYLLTTASLVGRETEAEIFTEDGGHWLAQVVSTDPFFDLAVLEVPGGTRRFEDVEPLALPDEPRAGAPCLILGSAYGRSLSLAEGRLGGTFEILPGGLPVRVHRILAPIFPGDSGGLVVDGEGRFVGILTGVSDPRRAPVLNAYGEIDLGSASDEAAGAVGFAIPGRECARAWTDLPRYRHIQRGYLGMQVDALGRNDAGVRVLQVTPGGPADRAGLQPGDVITTLGDAFLTSGKHLCAIVASTAPHSVLDVHAIRGNREFVVPVEIDLARERPGLHGVPAPPSGPPRGQDNPLRRTLPASGSGQKR